jgi:hypothetical protein
MGSHMKTTLDLADPLFHAAKTMATEQRTTLRALVEEGLRLVMDKRKMDAAKPYKYQDLSVKGEVDFSDPTKWHELEMEWVIGRMERSDRYLLEDIAARDALLAQQKATS